MDSYDHLVSLLSNYIAELKAESEAMGNARESSILYERIKRLEQMLNE
jgi:hypothetical protein